MRWNPGIDQKISFSANLIYMFRHTGEARTLHHNLRIASLLSFVAGLVNVAGFLAVQRLTTNVTGHFAFFVDEVYKLDFLQAFVFFLHIFFFFLGSFVSGFLVEWVHKKKESYTYIIPALLETLILCIVIFFGPYWINHNPDYVSFLLLFAMGLQNSLVTTISNAIVRTTHLTGLFTDLGIEISQLFFYKAQHQQQKLKSSIRLRLTIISFFFLGGIMGGVLYGRLQIYVLSIAALALFLGISFDYIRYRYLLLKRKYLLLGRNDKDAD